MACYAGRGRWAYELGRLGDDQRLHDSTLYSVELFRRALPRDQAKLDRFRPHV